MAIISLYYVEPFHMDHDLIQPRITASGLSNKMYVLYLAFTLQSDYTDARMNNGLIHLGKYIE
jgi:hypothetical protein